MRATMVSSMHSAGAAAAGPGPICGLADSPASGTAAARVRMGGSNGDGGDERLVTLEEAAAFQIAAMAG